MHLHHESLSAVAPGPLLDGFDMEIIPHETNLIAGQPLAEHFANHYYEITVECDGSNRHYPNPSALTLLLTNYVAETSNIGISHSGAVGIIILKPYESFVQGQIREVCQANTYMSVLLLMIRNKKDGSLTTLAYQLAQSQRHYN